MTFATMCIGLFPIMWSTGTGADVMKRIAAPMVGGICTSFLLELLVYPAIYAVWRQRMLGREAGPLETVSTGCVDSLQARQDDLVLRLESSGSL
jgi:copper/silver efflux system protein